MLGGFGMDDLPLLGVPLDLLAGSESDDAQHHHFGQCARLIEVARGGLPVRIAASDSS
jgi:hypothetical protein